MVAALEADDYEGALTLLLEQARATNAEERERIRDLMVALFTELGQDHPLSERFRRQLATALY